MSVEKSHVIIFHILTVHKVRIVFGVLH
uniref:Uncharacterized protein n=1 Tax=Rhizophora mucronata TaxID=61149 RepID=A0A2P2PRD3_RHIMU